jgi:hypothetical protein
MRPTNKTFYTCPEIYASQEFDGVKADLWSCTTMLFIMLTGIPAFVKPIVGDTRFLNIAEGNIDELFTQWGMRDYLSDDALGNTS